MQTAGEYLKSDSFKSLKKGKRNRIVFVLVTSFLGVAISLFFFAISIGKPYLGVNLSLTPKGWVVQSVDTNGVASQAGIKQGDKPVEINGQPADIVLAKYRTSGTVFGPFFNELVATDTQGKLKTANLAAGSLSWQMVTQQLALAMISVILWLVGFYAFLKRPDNTAAKLLFLFGTLAGLALSGSLAGEVSVPAAIQLQIISAIIAPWLLVHFMLVLPEENAQLQRKRLIYLVYLPAAVTLILLPIVGWKDGQPVQWFRTVRLFEYAGGFMTAIIVAVVNYFHSRSIKTKQQMRIVLLSVLAALLPVLLLNVIPFAVFRETIIPPSLSILFVGFIPLGMGYAVVARSLMDIDVVIRRGIVYGAITLVMTAILSLALFIGLSVRDVFGISHELLLALVAGVLATALFGPTKKGIEVMVDRLFTKTGTIIARLSTF